MNFDSLDSQRRMCANALSPSSSKTVFFLQDVKKICPRVCWAPFVRSQLHLYHVDVLGLVHSGRVPTEKNLFSQGYLPVRI